MEDDQSSDESDDVVDEDAPTGGDGPEEEDVDNRMMMETMLAPSADAREIRDDVDDDESDDEIVDDNMSCQGWTYLSGSTRPEVFISVDGVDNRLLDRAREEIPAVLMNIKKKLRFRRDRDISKISPGDCLKAFMDPTFLGYMKAYINSHINNRNDDVSNSDIMAFIRVELMISFYKVRTVLVVDDVCSF